MNSHSQLRERLGFLACITIITILAFNIYLLSEYETFSKTLSALPYISASSLSGWMVGVTLLLTALANGILLITSKIERGNRNDFPLLISMAGIIINYTLLFKIVSNEPGAIILKTLIGITFVLIVLMLILNTYSQNEKLYQFIWFQTFMLPPIVLVAVLVFVPVWVLRRTYDYDMSMYFLNPIVVSAVFMLVHFLNSCMNTSGNRSTRTRVMDILVYTIFLVTLILTVPQTIKLSKYSALPVNAKTVAVILIGLYFIAAMAILDVIRPASYHVERKQFLKLTSIHALTLTVLSATVGFIIWLIHQESVITHAKLSFSIMGHASAGFLLGVTIPIWYRYYEKNWLPKLNSYLHQSTSTEDI